MAESSGQGDGIALGIGEANRFTLQVLNKCGKRAYVVHKIFEVEKAYSSVKY